MSFDFFEDLDFNAVEWNKEFRTVGALTGSVVGSYVSQRLAFSLAMRVVTVVGASYSGAILAGAAYMAWEHLNNLEEEE